MNSKIKIVFLLFLVVNSLWAMSRLGPLSNQFLSGLRRSAPGDAALASRRLLNSSVSSSQPLPFGVGVKGTGYRGRSGVARKMTLLENKVRQQKEAERAGSLINRIQMYDKRIQQGMKDSLVGSIVTTIGLTLAGRYLYDSYMANKKAHRDDTAKAEIEVPSVQSDVNALPETLKKQEEQSNWGDFLANKWNAFTSGIMGGNH